MNQIKTEICCIFNLAVHYRATIYKLMDKELHCDFYITYWKDNPFLQMDYNELKNLKATSKNIKLIGRFYWQINAIRQIFKPYKYYILNGDPSCISTWFILFLSFPLNKKILFWSHGWYGKENNIEKFVKRIFFTLSTNVLLYGKHAKDLMIKEGIKEEKLHIIYNSLDYDKQLALRKVLKPSKVFVAKFQNHDPNLIFIGRLTSIKRLDLILHALKELKVMNKHFNLTLIGDGEKNELLNELTIQLGLVNRVWFYGESYNEEELSELIYNADLCVSPGNVGLTAMHSMAYGTPVITHSNLPYQMPEFEAILEGKTGAFFEQGNIDSLAQCIKDWFMKTSPREVIRNNCYEVIDTKYNPHKQIATLKRILF